MTRKVLIIPDEPYWALDKCAKDLVKYNQSDLQLDICYYDDFEKEWQKYYESYDLLFPMYSGTFFTMVRKKLPYDKMVTGIRSFIEWDRKKSLPPGFNRQPQKKFIKKLRSALLLNTHCAKLWYIFVKHLPIIHTKYTCDLELFYPEEKVISAKLKVGWAGSLKNHKNKRGFEEFIKPICNEIPDIELIVQAKENKFITDDNEMRQFYNSIDLYICASRTEGTPRPVIEASACGVPVISTDVGIVPELIDNEVNGFIVEREYSAIKSKLLWIVNNREILPQMGEAIRSKMEMEFNWKNLIFQWTDFFKFALELKRLKEGGFYSTV